MKTVEQDAKFVGIFRSHWLGVPQNSGSTIKMQYSHENNLEGGFLSKNAVLRPVVLLNEVSVRVVFRKFYEIYGAGIL